MVHFAQDVNRVLDKLYAMAPDPLADFEREERFHRWYYDELAKFDRGEPSQLHRDGNVTWVLPQPITQADFFAHMAAGKDPFEGQEPKANGKDREAQPSLDAALSYAQEFGWKSFPAYLEWNEDKQKFDKKSYFKGDDTRENWGMTNDPEQLKKNFNDRRCRKAGVGVPTGAVNKLVDIETDTVKGHGFDKDTGAPINGEAALQKLEAELGPLPRTREGESPSASVHRLFKHPGPGFHVKSVDGLLGHKGVDVKGDGGMFIAPPSRRADGEYRWINDLPIAELPEKWRDALTSASAPTSSATTAGEKYDFDRVEEEQLEAPIVKLKAALKVAPDEVRNCRKGEKGKLGRIDIGQIIKNATVGQGLEAEGRELFLDFVSECLGNDYNEDRTIEKWDSFKLHRNGGSRVGAGTLFMHANEWSPGWWGFHLEAEEEAAAEAAEAKTETEKKPEEPKQPESWVGVFAKGEEDARAKAEQDTETPPIEPKRHDGEEDVVDLWEKQKPPPLPMGLLPPVIEAFALRQSELTGCDPAGLAMGALTICGAAITDLIQIQPKQHDLAWKQSARIWVALGGPVSAIKSAQMDYCTKPYNVLDLGFREEYKRDMDYYEALDDEKKKSTAKPKMTRLCIEDTTPEALQTIMEDNVRGQLLVRDELAGFFGGLDKYSGNRGGSYDRGFWLKAYNGGQYTFDRVKRGSGLIKNCGISILGGIQEDTLRTFVNEGIDDGLIQRMLIIMLRAAVKGKNIPLPPHQYDELINKLSMLKSDINTYTFNAEGEAVRDALEQTHLDLTAAWERRNKKLASHIGKYNGIFNRLCLIWHCIKNIDAVGFAKFDMISGETAQEVADFLHKFLLPHAVSFYIGVLGLSDQHDELMDTAGYILAHKLKKITPRDVQRGSGKMRGLEKRDINRLFENLEAFGWLFGVRKPSSSEITWFVNEKVHTLFATKAEEERERRQRERAMIIDTIKGRT